MIRRHTVNGVAHVPCKRIRPKLCTTCGASATTMELTPRAQVVMKLDRTLRAGIESVGAFYCDEHTGIT